MIKAVIFDYGGVVTAGGGGNGLAEQLAPKLTITIEEAIVLLKQPWFELIRGKVTETEFWSLVEKGWGKPISKDARNIWNSWDDMKPRDDVLAYIENLKSKGYVVGLLSNVIRRTESFLRENGVYDLFEPCVLSCNEGIAKPEIDIYTHLLKLLGDVRPHEIIYIDDQEKCLIPANELGMKTVLAVNSQQIITDINRLLEL